MSRILLLCFVHGFKGDDSTFGTFPEDLRNEIARVVPDHRVETVVYPRYETKGELADASVKLLEWLKARVLDLRKAHLDAPWPPNDHRIGVVLVAHSMGGFVAADALFLALDERRERMAASAAEPAGADASPPSPSSSPLFPPIQGLVAFDTPYNGLSRAMFVYGAVSHYTKVQTVVNAMTALSAGPVALGKLALSRASVAGSGGSSSTGRRAWQLAAVRTGTVGALAAAGGVAAYTHRKAIVAGVKKIRMRGGRLRQRYHHHQRQRYQSGGGVGVGVSASLSWLAAHVTFVGALVRQAELGRRLRRLARLQGVGVRAMYASLGANGYWSGGYFVPERTFCAVPEAEADVAALFERCLMTGCDDEVQAHMGLFARAHNRGYDDMTRRTAVLAARWFEEHVHVPIVDGLPDESPSPSPPPPIDISRQLGTSADTAIIIEDDDDDDDKAKYLRHLRSVAQNASTGLKRVGQWSAQWTLPLTALPTLSKSLFTKKEIPETAPDKMPEPAPEPPELPELPETKLAIRPAQPATTYE